MGYDAQSDFPPGTRAAEVIEHLQFMGFTLRQRKARDSHGQLAWLEWRKNDHYQYYRGLSVLVVDDSGQLVLRTRANTMRTRADAELNNDVLRQMRRRFGASFPSDYGKNRYFPVDGLSTRSHAPGGCYAAFEAFLRSMKRAGYYLGSRKFDVDFSHLPPNIRWMTNGIDPTVLSNSLLVPFIVASLEEFFRQTFTVLFKYSPSKERVLKAAKINAEDLVAAMDGDREIEEVAVKWFNFQSVAKIGQSFSQLEPKLDILGPLRRPTRKGGKENLAERIEQVIARRHRIIHQNEVDGWYTTEEIANDLAAVEAAAARVYELIFKFYGWEVESPLV